MGIQNLNKITKLWTNYKSIIVVEGTVIFLCTQTFCAIETLSLFKLHTYIQSVYCRWATLMCLEKVLRCVFCEFVTDNQLIKREKLKMSLFGICFIIKTTCLYMKFNDKTKISCHM